MASGQGTLLSDLDTKEPLRTGGNDDDLMRQVYADMNNQGQPAQQQQLPMGYGQGPPPPQLNSYKIQQPNANTVYNQAVDPAVPTAHMIGSQHPNPADFATTMAGYGQGTPYQSQQQQNYPPQQYLQPQQQSNNGQEKFNWKAYVFEHLRQPILVAIIVFILSLPAVNVLFQCYAPALLRSGGDLNTWGLLARATLAGGAYWALVNVIGPLMS